MEIIYTFYFFLPFWKKWLKNYWHFVTGKTAKSILISVGVRLAAFNLKQIANLTCTDELDLYSIGEKKVALFCCIPDADWRSIDGKRMPWNRWFDDSVASSFGGETGFMILWILELVSYLSVLSWGISFQLVEKPAEIKLIIISDNLRNLIDGISCCFK